MQSMGHGEIVSLLESRCDELALLGVKSLALFGSTARGTAGPESDADFLVEFEGPPSFDRYADLMDLLERLLGLSVDLITRPSLPAWMQLRVEQEALYVSGL